MPAPKKNDLLELEIEGLAFGGPGVAKPDGFVVFVDRAAPGDRLRARVTKKAKNHAHAVIESIEAPGPARVEPPCHLFHRCGGCDWQHLTYDEQLVWKQRQVVETLEHLGKMESAPEIRPIVPSPSIWNQRNKMEFTFGVDEGRGVELGFHVPGRFDRIFEVDKCLIHPEPFDALLGGLTAHAREHGLTGHDPRRHEGFLRQAVMRHSTTTGGVTLTLLTDDGELPERERMVERLRASCPELQGMLWGINRGLADVARIDEERWRWGDLALVERINGLTFVIGPTAFFQTNTAAAEKLYQVVVEMAELGPEDRLLDAYCGAGAIALHCARRVERAVGIELSREAVWNARENAEANAIGNAVFLAAPVNEGLPLALQAAGGAFTRVVIDPPRGGMDKKSLAALIDLRAPVFVYVSCNPSTLARDLQTLAQSGYRVEALQAVDMFPHSHHIEAVARLRLSP